MSLLRLIRCILFDVKNLCLLCVLPLKFPANLCIKKEFNPLGSTTLENFKLLTKSYILTLWRPRLTLVSLRYPRSAFGGRRNGRAPLFTFYSITSRNFNLRRHDVVHLSTDRWTLVATKYLNA